MPEKCGAVPQAACQRNYPDLEAFDAPVDQGNEAVVRGLWPRMQSILRIPDHPGE